MIDFGPGLLEQCSHLNFCSKTRKASTFRDLCRELNYKVNGRVAPFMCDKFSRLVVVISVEGKLAKANDNSVANLYQSTIG